ncbi:MAG TPA: metallophosphoesterase [Candidatus Korarchaeota archaeon]|nr:metallophosphoesterase [Candidatus Korarchaeota archaeon]
MLYRMEIIEGIELVPYGIFLSDMRALAIADLHIGYEEALLESGIHLPKSQYPKIKEKILHLLDELKPKVLIIVGDVKHEFGEASRQEWIEVLDLLDTLQERVELHVVRGNHDNYLIPILKRREVPLHDPYLEMGDCLFAHGHKEVSPEVLSRAKILVMGHEHPAVTFRDEVGAKTKFKCHLIGRKDGSYLLILPAISPLAPGADVSFRSLPFSPLLRDVELDSFRVVVIDEEAGAYDFGFLGDLKRFLGTKQYYQ